MSDLSKSSRPRPVTIVGVAVILTLLTVTATMTMLYVRDRDRGDQLSIKVSQLSTKLARAAANEKTCKDQADNLRLAIDKQLKADQLLEEALGYLQRGDTATSESSFADYAVTSNGVDAYVRAGSDGVCRASKSSAE